MGIDWSAGRTRLSALVLVCGATGLASYVLTRHVPLGPDEVVYVTQFDPRHLAAPFGAPRARGVPVLVAPIVALTSSVSAMRAYLAALMAIVLLLSYATWLQLRRDWVPALAVLLFGTLWITLFYLGSAMPNTWTAAGAVAATGSLLLIRRDPGHRAHEVGLVVSVVVVCLIRPSEGLVLVGALALAVLRWPRDVRRRPLIVLAATAVVGWLPWVVEAQLGFGGVLPRVIESAAEQHTPRSFQVDLHLRALNGPLLCRPCVRAHHPIPVSGVLWWLAGAALVGLAVYAARTRTTSRDLTLLPVWVAGCFAVSYLPLGYGAPRFLLPIYALLALPAAEGLLQLTHAARGPAARRLVAGVVVTVLAVHVGVQVRETREQAQANSTARLRQDLSVAKLARLGIQPPCLLVGVRAVSIAYRAGCQAKVVTEKRGEQPFSPADVARWRQRVPTALVQRRHEPRPAWAAGWRKVRLPTRDLAFIPPPPPR